MTALEEESAALKAQLASLQQIGIHSDVDSAQEAIRRLYAALPDEQRKEMFQELASSSAHLMLRDPMQRHALKSLTGQIRAMERVMAELGVPERQILLDALADAVNEVAQGDREEAGQEAGQEAEAEVG